MAKTKTSLFAKYSAKHFFIVAIVAFVLSLTVSATAPQGLIPGILIGGLGWVAIIFLIAGIIKWLSSLKKK